MPPSKDLTAKLKEFQATASPDACEAIFAKWIASFAEVESNAAALEALSIEVENAQPSKDAAPAKVMDAVKAYRMLLQNIAKDLGTLKAAILMRIPEIKEEDNLGVNVQLQVNEQLKAFINRVNGNGGGKDEGSSSFPSVFFAKEYLSGRAAIEEKLLGSEKDGPSKSQSLTSQLAYYDADTVARLSRALREVMQTQQFMISCFTLNYKKLYNPRADRVMH